ncbi:MAG TPA: DUF4126 family protein [Solirubrobacteraceae bacterium]|nr:DUF4126 family protein [Solirubrobacteraceae bacterium]
MKLFLDLLQGAGLAAAAGIRPFLPTLAAGALAAGNVGVDFDHTKFAFLERAWFLAIVAAALLIAVVFRRALERPAAASALAGIGVGLGALLFAGSLADRHHTWWYGLPLGIAFGLLGSAAARSLFTRVHARLDRDAQGALPVYFDGSSLVLGALAVLIPPISLVALPFLGWLLSGGRRRAQRKYAGLRILR